MEKELMVARWERKVEGIVMELGIDMYTVLF